MPGGTRRPVILVVEDELLIRKSALDFLEDAGFCVLEANNALQGSAIFEERLDIGAIFTDIGIKAMFNGLIFAHLVSIRRPQVRVLVTSGSPRASVYSMPSNCRFLPKPYSPTCVTSALLGFTSAHPAVSASI